MATYSHTVGGQTWRFDDLREVLAKASPARSGDQLAGLAAGSDVERVAAQMTLADLPLQTFLNETVVDYLRIVPEGVFEGEELPILEATPPVARRQDMRAFGKQWSRDAQLWFTPPSSDASITFESRLERPGPRNICAFFTKAPDYGVYQLLVDDAPVGEPFDGFHGGVARSERVCFGVHEFDEGAHRITFRCVGKNEQSSNYMLGLDVLELALP